MSKSEKQYRSLAKSHFSDTSIFVLRTYSILGCLSLAVFGALNIFGEDKANVGYLELGGAGVFLLNLLTLQATKRLDFAKTIFIVNMLLFLALMLVSGGMHNTGVYWFFLFPIAAFVLCGQRAGLGWLAACFIMIGVMWALASAGTLTLPYDTVAVRQLVISLAVAASGIYLYQRSRERLEVEQQTSQEQLKGEKVRSDVIVRHIDEGIVTTDDQGRVTFMNPTAQRILGWDFTELKGKPFIEAVPLINEEGQEVPTESRPLHRSLRHGGSVTMTARYRVKDGSIVPVSATGTSIEVDGKPIGGIVTFRDVTEEQDTARAKSEFVTLASHQLRTPISAISWMSELLLNEDAGKLSREQKEHIEAIYASNHRMAALVSEMLVVSSLELHTLPVLPEKVDLGKLSSKVIHDLLADRKETSRKIEERYTNGLPQVACDPDILRNILRHLLTNSLKYTPKSGKITLDVSTDPAMKLHTGSKGSVVLVVSDTGYGIPEEASDRIFTKFFRSKNIKSKDTDGTGLGLYIVKALLDYVGGHVSFASKEGKGTAFTVLLPLEGMTTHRPQPNSIGPASRKSVMKGVTHV